MPQRTIRARANRSPKFATSCMTICHLAPAAADTECQNPGRVLLIRMLVRCQFRLKLAPCGNIYSGMRDRASTAATEGHRSSVGDENLKSLFKISRILDCFSTVNRALSLREICDRTGLPKSTTHRLIASMREVGLLDQDREGDRYRLGLKLFELGNIVLANMDLHREARPFVEALTRVSGHVVHLAVFDGRQAVVIHRSDPSP